MYFLNEEERLYLNKSLIPKSRGMYIDRDLRGWNWQSPPIEPIYDLKLGVFEVANNYCPTNMDLFLRRVLGVKVSPNKQMVEGSILHNAIMHFITESKRNIYNHPIEEINSPELYEIDDKIEDIILGNNNDMIRERVK